MSVKNEEIADKLEQELKDLLLKNNPTMVLEYAKAAARAVRSLGGLSCLWRYVKEERSKVKGHDD